MGCICFITLLYRVRPLYWYRNVWPGAIVHVIKIVYKEIKMLLHDMSWIPISVQSFISIYFLVIFGDTLV